MTVKETFVIAITEEIFMCKMIKYKVLDSVIHLTLVIDPITCIVSTRSLLPD